jgi:hypothetical protein
MPKVLIPSIPAVLALILYACSAVFAQSPDGDRREVEVIKKARAALGGEAALNAVGTLSASGDFRVGSGEMLVSGDVKLAVRIPDRLMRILKWSLMETINVTTTEAMSGEQVWRESKSGQHNPMTGLVPGSSGGTGHGGGRGSGENGKEGRGKKEAPPGLDDGMNDHQLRSYFSCLILALLLRSPDLAPGVQPYQGEVTIEGAKADSLKIRLKDGLDVNLFIDQATHWPLMVGYSIPGYDSSISGGKPRRRKQGESSEAATREPEVMAVEIFLSEYKPVAENKFGNIWLPHQITRTSGGLTVEDMHIKSFQLNPRLEEKQFEPKR